MIYTGKAVQIMAMSECPNKCEHCFINYKGKIPFEELEKILSNFTKLYSKVILNGTELLMDERYLSLCQMINQDFIYTNGTLLTLDTIELLKKHRIHRLSISLHYGIQEKLSKAKLEDISEKIKTCVSKGFDVRVLCTISKGNYRLVPEIAEYVYSLGVKSLKFVNLIDEGKGERFSSELLSEDDIREFFYLLSKTRMKYNKNDFTITRNGGFGNNKDRSCNFYCPAGEDWVTILPDHSVYPCNGLLYDKYRIGHWDENGIYLDKPFARDCKECKVLSLQLDKTSTNK